ncbi:hypothetical protein E0L16_01655 [Enterobacter quasihormaechei]|uniref:Uncharacterized protein n=1 Tax=Enterobacter quasihormaechei TaxID=2529382 RepID=A0AAE8R046_9ENTR|nr:hypothetical protein E0L16_01655 [Enterobacter quasihormaechei]
MPGGADAYPAYIFTPAGRLRRRRHPTISSQPFNSGTPVALFLHANAVWLNVQPCRTSIDRRWHRNGATGDYCLGMVRRASQK